MEISFENTNMRVIAVALFATFHNMSFRAADQIITN